MSQASGTLRHPIVSGQRYGRLTAIEPAGFIEVGIKRRRRVSAWRFRCECGTEKVLAEINVKNGNTKSCGNGACRGISGTENVNFQHGLSDRREYFIWKGMIRRCEDPAAGRYKDYGGRGIKVCARWRASLENFLADMGPRPSPKHTLDRIDNDGHYEPGNVRWAISKEQDRNKRTTRTVVYQGREMPLKDACEITGMKYHTAQCRLDRGWEVERALTAPLLPSRWSK